MRLKIFRSHGVCHWGVDGANEPHPCSQGFTNYRDATFAALAWAGSRDIAVDAVTGHPDRSTLRVFGVSTETRKTWDRSNARNARNREIRKLWSDLIDGRDVELGMGYGEFARRVIAIIKEHPTE